MFLKGIVLFSTLIDRISPKTKVLFTKGQKKIESSTLIARYYPVILSKTQMSRSGSFNTKQVQMKKKTTKN